MLDHFGINCSDLAEASAFYDDVLSPLGHHRLMDLGVAIGGLVRDPDGNNVEAVCHRGGA